VDLASFTQLLTPEGQAALDAAVALEPDTATFLACFNRLSKTYPADLVRAALETAILRRRAQAKFSRADRMYFTREALEQSSGEIIARHRAVRFGGFPLVADLCCGIGGDTLALAQHRTVLAIDADPLRLAMAEANAAAYEVRDRVTFRAGDVLDLLDQAPAWFLDPDRRAGGRRHVSLSAYQPRPDAVLARLPAVPALGMKLAPAVPWEELRAFDAEVEFLSVDGELRECCLWFGPLRKNGRRATQLPGPRTLAADIPAAAPDPGEPLAVLYDPDPAVVRAGLVTNLAVGLGARQIDPEIAYLTAERFTPTPFARAWRIEAAFPFQLRRLKEWLRAHHIGRVNVHRRGSAVDPEDLTRRLKLSGDEVRDVFLTRVLGRPFVLIGQGIQCP
jgi:SAM-dependent methyltransferase